MPTALHLARLDSVLQCLRDSGARSVLDLGCGPGELLLRLAAEPQFERILGIDIDTRVLARARAALDLDWLGRSQRVSVMQASFEDFEPALAGFDAAVMLETIEHIDPGRLSRVERAVFGQMRPATVLITTPNTEYNLLHGMAPGQKRHPGHRFEWTRAQFRQWAEGVALRQGYALSLHDLGPVDARLGSSTQMALFQID